MTMSRSFFTYSLLRPGLGRSPHATCLSVLAMQVEVNGRLVGPLVFKTSGTGDPRPVGSIPATSAGFWRLRRPLWVPCTPAPPSMGPLPRAAALLGLGALEADPDGGELLH